MRIGTFIGLLILFSAAHADTLIDDFSDAQSTTSQSEEMASGALGMVRFLDVVTSGQQEMSVAGDGTATCRETVANGFASCRIIYDGVDDDADMPETNGLSNVNLISSGETMIPIVVTEFTGTTGQIDVLFHPADPMGDVCNLSTGVYNAPGTYNLLFTSDPQCVGLNDIGGVRVNISLNGPGSSTTFSMLETTPVTLLKFDVD